MKNKDKPGILSVIQREIRLLNAIPLLWVSFFVISLVPTFYALTYLGSIWDPYGKLPDLPVALVNRDSGVEFDGQHYELGKLLVHELERKQSFGFVELENRQDAVDAVIAGEAYFALVIPEDFSGKALPGREIGELELITSAGTSYTASLIGKKFTEVAVENLNHRLEAKRWEVVLDSGGKALDAGRLLEEGAERALKGAHDLSSGIETLRTGAGELNTGQARLAKGLGSIDTEKLVSAGRTLHQGTEKLANGLADHKLIDRLAGIDREQLLQLAEGAALYQQKIGELAAGLDEAASGAVDLQQGGEQLGSGIDRLQAGSVSLADGLSRLHEGLQQFVAAFPSGERNAESMAGSVTSRHTALNAVESNGQGFSPFLMGFSLWIGAMSASFVFLMNTFSKNLAGAGAMARVFGKEFFPAAMCVAGALMLGLAIQWKGTDIQNVPGYFSILALAGLTYNSITLLLIRALGDSGKLLALLLLVVQLASASGAYPIELSAPFYQAISPYLPMTSVVDGLRAAMFGSFGGDWQWFALKLVPWLAGCWILSLFAIRRTDFVEDQEYGPALRLAFGNNRSG